MKADEILEKINKEKDMSNRTGNSYYMALMACNVPEKLDKNSNNFV